MATLDYPCKNTFRQALKPLAIISLVIITGWITKTKTHAENPDEKYNSVSEKLEKKLGEQEKIRKELNEISEEISKLASQSSLTQSEIDQLQRKITALEIQIDELNENLKDRRKTMAQKETLRNMAIRNLSKKSLLTEWEKFIGSSGDLSSLSGFEYATFNYIFDRALSKDALNWIKVLNEEIVGFETNKEEALSLKEEIAQAQKDLVALKVQLDGKKGELEEEEGEKTGKLLSLEEEIAKLSAKQKAILEQKYGTGNISGYESAEYKLPSCPFDKGFAAMSYGAFTHYKGMSQYGARGRAKDGEDYKEILEFYYDTGVEEKDNFPNEICVEGYGDMDFQKYLYGIAEMPDTWPEEALKAQAIAARSYAYRFVKAGKCICTTQSCQVFLKSKSDNPPGDWKDAVKDTEDKILKDGVIAYYSSTTGGYIENIGWDLNGDQWPSDAYEKKGGSPWFYKAWHTQTYHSNSSTCGRSTPWLSEKEMADILNAWIVWRKGKDSDKDNVTPVTTSCWGGDPYSMDKMADKAEDYDGKFTSVSEVHTPAFNSGRTTEICFETNRGKKCIDGEEFKTVFNLRAPGYVAIRSRLFDIEMDD